MPEPIQFLLGLFLSAGGILLLLRFMLQVAKADFYSPWTQGIIRITDTVCNGLRRMLPKSQRLDFASLLVAWATYSVLVFLPHLGAESFPSVIALLLQGLFRLMDTLMFIYLVSSFAVVVMSWIDPRGGLPISRLAGEITAPIMEPARRLLPPLAGLDLSPMIVIIGLLMIRQYVLPEIARLFF